MNIKFNSLLIKTDVTAVKITKKFIFAAIGSHLHIFEKYDYKLVKRIQIFEGINCFGIEFSHDYNHVLLYGENRMKILSLNLNTIEIFELCEHSTKDWIIFAKWTNNGDIVALTMHNILIVYNSCFEEKCRYISEENCIIYSGFICYDFGGELVIFSGTVFSEVLIWKAVIANNGFCSVLHRLKGHKGVIFSIHCAPTLELLCSTSDDRTAMLWKTTIFNPEEKNEPPHLLCTVNGHTSRIFRCRILENYFATAGEDSLVNIWNFQGDLIKKIVANKGDSVWALDYDETEEILVVGNGDGAIIATKLNNHLNFESFTAPKARRLAIVNDGNLIFVTEDGFLYHFTTQKHQLDLIASHTELKSYALLEVSRCRNLVAIAGFYGDIFIYKTKTQTLKLRFKTVEKERIYSFHWLTCNLFLTCEKEGNLKLWCLCKETVICVTKFFLPPSKERWSTCACLVNKKTLIVGDRKGNLHIFCIGQLNVMQSIKKAHSHLGVTYLTVNTNNVYSLGRNGVLKVYSFNCENQRLVEKTSDKLPFSWLTKMEAHDERNFLLGFTGNEFLIWDCEERRNIFQHPCGGGHRSWDFYKTNNCVIFAYLKEQSINVVTTDWSTLSPVNIVKGLHSLEINALTTIPNKKQCILLTGGEDTTFQLSTFCLLQNLLHTIENLKSHLSSIRCNTKCFIKKEEQHNKTIKHYAIFSAGGRAQIVLWLLTIEEKNDDVKSINCYKKFSFHENLADDESEMRIMDMTSIKHENTIFLFAACSDGKIKIFVVDTEEITNMKLILLQNLMHRPRCILKISNFTICNKTVLLTATTEGKIAFWNFENSLSDNLDSEPFFEIVAHQSGINTCSYYKINENVYAFLTGGDDNAIVLHIFRFQNDCNSVEILSKYVNVSSHCAQVTGAFITDNYFITTSIDQKVLLFQWHYSNTLSVNSLAKYNSSIADVQGMQVLINSENKSFYVILYGKGIEIVNVSTK